MSSSSILSSVRFLLIWIFLCHLGSFSHHISLRETTIESQQSYVTVTQIGEQVALGEGPFWDAENQVLYYVDIQGQKVHKYDPATKKDTYFEVAGGLPSFVMPVKGEKNKFLISMTLSLAIVTWDGESTTPDNIQVISTVEKDKPKNRINDGKAAPDGSLWAGTMQEDHARINAALYLFLDPQSPVIKLDHVGESNGLTWTRDMKKMYYIDTETYKVDVFEMDASTENITNRRTVIDFSEDRKIRPDGMTIDTEGKLWVANANGSTVVRIDPETGTIMETVTVPARKVTCVVFGGPDLDQLYITTSRNLSMTKDDLQKYPLTGFTFHVTGLGVKGYAGDHVTYISHNASNIAAPIQYCIFIITITAILYEHWMHLAIF